MEEFILNHHPQPDGQSGLPRPGEMRDMRSGATNLAASSAQNPVAGPVMRPSGGCTSPGDSCLLGHLPNTPLSRLRPPGEAEDGRAVFLTWVLHGSLPDGRALPNGENLVWQDFVTVDRLLDEARSGPLYLGRREIAAMVVGTVVAYGTALRQYALHSYVVMPNHLHLLLTPQVELRELTEILTTATARQANELLNQPGAPFWDVARCEHVVLEHHEFRRISQHIEGDPVPVGMAREAADYPFSSAGRKAFAQRA